MSIELSLTAAAVTTATFAFGSMGGDGTLELQISPRKDFKHCIAPVYAGIARVSPQTFSGLNQRGTFYARARNRTAAGVADAWSNVVGFRTLDGTAQAISPAAIMVEPALIVIPEDVVNLTAGNAVAGFPAINLLRDAPVAWRSSANNFVHTLTIEAAGQPIDTIALLNTNLPEAATIRVQGADTLAGTTGGAPGYDSGEIAFRASLNLPQRNGYHGLVQLGGARRFRFYRIDIAGPTPAGLLHAEHLVIGLNLRSKNHALEKTEAPVHLGSLERTRSGNPDRQEGYKMRRVEFELAMLTEAQYETLYAPMIRELDRPIFVVPNSKSGGFLHDRMLYGDLRGGRVVQPHSPRYTRSFTVESLI